jgi:hypothetical protein
LAVVAAVEVLEREDEMPGVPREALLSKVLGFGFALLVVTTAPVAAMADGLPVLGVDVGSEGVTARTSPIRYVTLPAAGGTVVARTAVRGGRVLAFTQFPGTFTIPAVAYDGSASGLSADSSTLVLIQPRLRFPRAQTPLLILDAKRLRMRKLVTLRGDFSFDAISPRGRTLFLIQYLSARDPARYKVRAYDVRAGRLRASAVVDPHEQGVMRGSPVTRATSSNGRWAYTLYNGAGGTPFIHALDTSKSQARCIDLPMLRGRQDLSQLRITIAPDQARLTVGTAGQKLAVVDTRSFRVSTPLEPAATTPALTSRHRDATWLPLGVAALMTALPVAALSLTFRRRRPRMTRTASKVAGHGPKA